MTFNTIYHLHLAELLRRPEHEAFNRSFSLQSVDPIPLVESTARKFDVEYAKVFAQYTMAGGPFPAVLLAHRRDAGDFVKEVEGRNPAYGPRIQQQLPDVVEELRLDPLSRRATITILAAEDLLIRKFKRDHLADRVEYPCTIGLTFFVRNFEVCLHVAMRSSNACTTICYDIFNFVYLQHHVAKALGLVTGALYWNAANSHIPERELPLAKAILNEYQDKVRLL